VRLAPLNCASPWRNDRQRKIAGARLPAKASVLTMEISQFDGQFAAKRALIKHLYAAEASAADNRGSELAREGVDADDGDPSNSPASSRPSGRSSTVSTPQRHRPMMTVGARLPAKAPVLAIKIRQIRRPVRGQARSYKPGAAANQEVTPGVCLKRTPWRATRGCMKANL
jgi:hypothetical protein